MDTQKINWPQIFERARERYFKVFDNAYDRLASKAVNKDYANMVFIMAPTFAQMAIDSDPLASKLMEQFRHLLLLGEVPNSINMILDRFPETLNEAQKIKEEVLSNTKTVVHKTSFKESLKIYREMGEMPPRKLTITSPKKHMPVYSNTKPLWEGDKWDVVWFLARQYAYEQFQEEKGLSQWIQELRDSDLSKEELESKLTNMFPDDGNKDSKGTIPESQNQEELTTLELTNEDEKIEWLGDQKQLAELLATLEQKGWIRKPKNPLIKKVFTRSHSIQQLMKPGMDEKTKTPLYPHIYTTDYDPMFLEIRENIPQNQDKKKRD